MKKLLLAFLLFSGIVRAQSPVSPVQVSQNTVYNEPSTGLYWTFSGGVYGWRANLNIKDSAYYITPYYFNHHATYTAGYGLGLTSFQFRLDSTIAVNKTFFNTVIGTTALSRINARVKYTDTATMLSTYLHSGTASGLYITKANNLSDVANAAISLNNIGGIALINGLLHLTTLSALSSYSGVATSILVTDPLEGGIFNLIAGSATIDGAINVTSSIPNTYWRRQWTGPVIGEWFGAKGDGSTADQASLQACNDYATTNGFSWALTFGKTYKLTAQLIITTSFDGYNSFITVPGSTVANAILIQANKTANTTAVLSLATIRLPSITNSTKPSVGWAGQGNGVTINNALSCALIQTNVIDGFEINLFLTANFGIAGNSNNKYVLGRILDGDYDVKIQGQNSGSYINENTFEGAGGLLGYFNGTGAHAQLALLPDLADSTGGPNGNKFYNIDFETDNTIGASPAYNIILGGSFNSFYSCRYEFANADGRMLIYNNTGNDVTDNHFNNGYTFSPLFDVTIRSTGSNYGNDFINIGRAININSTNGTFANSPTGGNSVIWRVYPSSTNLFGAAIGDTNWLAQLTSGGNLQVKSGPFDTYPSVTLQPRAISFSDGTFSSDSGPFLEMTGTNTIGTTAASWLQAGATGTWNTGHLMIGGDHIWQDGTGALRLKTSAPSSSSDGAPIGTVSTISLATPNVIFSTPVTFSTNTSTGLASGALSLNTQNANTILAGPATGSATTPAFRSLVAADIPSLSYAPVSGSANYIQNQNSSQQSTSVFWTSGVGRIDGRLILGGGAGNGYTFDVNGTTSNFEIKSTTAGNLAYGIFQNSVATSYIGVEGSTGGQILVGAPAGSAVITTNAGGYYFGTSNVMRAFISNQGINAYIHTFLGSTSGAITVQASAVSPNVTLTYPTTSPSTGQVLAYGTPMTWVSLTSGTVTSVTSANTDISIATGTSTPVLTFNRSLALITPTNYYSSSTTPSISAGAAAGTTPTISILGNNQDGIIVVTTGTLPTIGTLCTVTMSASFAYPNSCIPVISPYGATSLIGFSSIDVGSLTATSFTLGVPASALAPATTYQFTYHNGGY